MGWAHRRSRRVCVWRAARNTSAAIFRDGTRAVPFYIISVHYDMERPDVFCLWSSLSFIDHPLAPVNVGRGAECDRDRTAKHALREAVGQLCCSCCWPCIANNNAHTQNVFATAANTVGFGTSLCLSVSGAACGSDLIVMMMRVVAMFRAERVSSWSSKLFQR